jgi:Holliday junction resolvasome RuvABC endonuclease subunit
MSAEAILGIDPGTRHVGIAVVRDGGLMHWKVKAYHGKWSHEKLHKIIQLFDATIKRDCIKKVVVKIPDVLPASFGFTQVIGSLNVLCERRGIRPRYVTHTEIKKFHCAEDKSTTEHLMAVIVRKHPELAPQYRRERENANAYYHKAFEAIALADMAVKE